MAMTEVPSPDAQSDMRRTATQLKERVSTLVAGFSKGQRMTLGVAGAAVVVLVLAVAWMSSGTEFTPLYTDMDPADAGAVTAKLKEMGTEYQLSAGGTTIEVPAADVYQVRADLASTDLPSASREGYGILDDQGLTTSEFGQRVGFQRAMEGELAKTIEALDGVKAAVVHLAIPKDEVFALEKSQATASVMVKTERTLGAEQVRAIRNLVSSSIESLDPQAVSITDSSGRVLAAPGEVEAVGGSGGSDDVVGEYQRRVAGEIESTLAASLGAGKVKATVAADLDLDQVSSTSESYEAAPLPEGQTDPLALEESVKSESYGSGAPATQGTLGSADAATDVGAGSGTYSLEESQKRNAVNKKVETIIRQPGSVRRLSVAVVVDESVVDAAQVAAITDVVSKAAGIDAARGDEVVVTRMPFDEALDEEMKESLEGRTEAAAGSSLLVMIGMGVLLLAIVVATFLVLRRRKRQLLDLEELAARAEQLSWEAPSHTVTQATPAIGFEDAEPSSSASLSPHHRDDRREALGDLIDNQPDEVAQLLRGWLADRRTVRR